MRVLAISSGMPPLVVPHVACGISLGAGVCLPSFIYTTRRKSLLIAFWRNSSHPELGLVMKAGAKRSFYPQKARCSLPAVQATILATVSATASGWLEMLPRSIAALFTLLSFSNGNVFHPRCVGLFRSALCWFGMQACGWWFDFSCCTEVPCLSGCQLRNRGSRSPPIKLSCSHPLPTPYRGFCAARTSNSAQATPHDGQRVLQ